MKKIISLLVVFTIVFGSISFAFADSKSFDHSNCRIEKVNDSRYIISIDDSKAVLSLAKTAEGESFEVKELTEGEAYYFIVNDKTDTIYSSLTDNTLNLSQFRSNNANAMVASNVATSFNVKISFAKLAELLLPDSSQVAWATAIIAIIAGAQGITIATSVTVVVTLLGAIGWTELKAGIVSKATNHGIKVTVNQDEIEKHQGGRMVKGYRYEIVGVSRY